MAMILRRQKTCSPARQAGRGPDKKTENAPSLIKLVHQPDKPAGVGPGTSARAKLRQSHNLIELRTEPMPSLRNNPWTSALWSVLLALAISGCQSGHKACEDIPPGAIPQPNGTYLCQWNHAEMARADRDNFVIYQYEWSADPTKLTQFGQDHLVRIAQGLPQVCFPVLIERSPDQHLDELRRMAVLEALANCHVPIVPERVVIGRSGGRRALWARGPRR